MVPERAATMRRLAEFIFRVVWAYLFRQARSRELWEGVPLPYRSAFISEFKIPDSLEDWLQKREEVVSIVRATLGELPSRPSPVNARITSVDQRDGYRIEKFYFNNGVDAEVPGLIAVPEHKPGPFPAVLTMHGHAGCKEHMFGYVSSHHNVAERLVRRGFVVFGIDDYGCGERRGKGPGGSAESIPLFEEMSLFKLNLWLGRTLWGMMLRDKQIALDYVTARPEVDPDRIGAQGMSMGSTHAWWLGSIDRRIKAAVAIGCFTRYQELIAMRELRAHGMYYFVWGLLRHFDTEGVLSLMAPRPLLALTGDRDPGSPVEGVRKLETCLQPLYALYGRPKAFRSVVYLKTGHVYTEEMKREMEAWFDKHL